jgi:hypothetical protein
MKKPTQKPLYGKPSAMPPRTPPGMRPPKPGMRPPKPGTKPPMLGKPMSIAQMLGGKPGKPHLKPLKPGLTKPITKSKKLGK